MNISNIKLRVDNLSSPNILLTPYILKIEYMQHLLLFKNCFTLLYIKSDIVQQLIQWNPEIAPFVKLTFFVLNFLLLFFVVLIVLLEFENLLIFKKATKQQQMLWGINFSHLILNVVSLFVNFLPRLTFLSFQQFLPDCKLEAIQSFCCCCFG